MFKGSFKYAWVLDQLMEERERGLTIDFHYANFKSAQRVYTVIDAPGHIKYTKNAISVAS